eukprot:gene5113-5619_t
MKSNRNVYRPPHSISADQVVDDYVRRVIREGGYVDTLDMERALGDRIDLLKVDFYFSMRMFNRKVDLSVDVFRANKAIRCFSELEKYIVAQISHWKKISPIPDTFDELGHGNLLANNAIINNFGFPSNRRITREKLHEISAREVIEAVGEFLSRNRYYSYSDEVGERLEQLLIEMVPEGKYLATSIDPRDVFFAFKGIKFNLDLGYVARSVQRDLRQKQQEELIHGIISTLDEEGTDLLEDLKYCQQLFKSKDKPLLKRLQRIASSMEPFPIVFYKLSQFITEIDGEISSEIAFLNQLNDIKLGPLQYKHDSIGGILATCVTILIFLLPSIAKHYTNTFVSSQDEMKQMPLPERLKHTLREICSADIPDFASQALRQLIDCASSGCFYYSVVVEETENDEEENKDVEEDVEPDNYWFRVRWHLRHLFKRVNKIINIRDEIQLPSKTQSATYVSPKMVHDGDDDDEEEEEEEEDCDDEDGDFMNTTSSTFSKAFTSKNSWDEGIDIDNQTTKHKIPSTALTDTPFVPHKRLGKDMLLPVITALIVYFRVTSVECALPRNNEYVEIENDLECQLDNICNGFSVPEEKDVSSPSLSVIQALKHMEDEIREERQCVTFEYFGLGSFLTFVSQTKSLPRIMNVLDQLFMNLQQEEHHPTAVLSNTECNYNSEGMLPVIEWPDEETQRMVIERTIGDFLQESTSSQGVIHPVAMIQAIHSRWRHDINNFIEASDRTAANDDGKRFFSVLHNMIEENNEMRNQFDELLTRACRVCFQSLLSTEINTRPTNEDNVQSSIEIDRIRLTNEIDNMRHPPIVVQALVCSILTRPLPWIFGNSLDESDNSLFYLAVWYLVNELGLSIALAKGLVSVALEDLVFDENRGCFRYQSSSSFVSVISQVLLIADAGQVDMDRFQEFCSQLDADNMNESNELLHVGYVRDMMNNSSQDAQSHVDNDVVREICELLSMIPCGERCAKSLFWQLCYAQRLREVHAEDPTSKANPMSILHYLSLYGAIVAGKCNDSVFLVTDHGSDVVRIPRYHSISTRTMPSLFDSVAVRSMLQSHEHAMLSALSLSAALHRSFGELENDEMNHEMNHDRLMSPWPITFRIMIHSSLLTCYELRGQQGLTSLVDDILQIGQHVFASLYQSREGDKDTNLHLLAMIINEWLHLISSISNARSEVIHHEAWQVSHQQRQSSSCVTMLVTLGWKFPLVFPTFHQLGFQHVSLQKQRLVYLEQKTSSWLTSGSQFSNNSTSSLSIPDEQSADQHVVHNTTINNLEPSSVVSQSVTELKQDDSCVGSTVDEKRKFIENFLRSEFHYDECGNRPSIESPEGRKLRRSLELLSASLYSSDVHFVMEILQNADDNLYPKGCRPTLKLQLFPHALVIFNNEEGFQERNIVAVCNVGGSTKQGCAGYIGQKGIGFKSVFSISDRPEIHSNDFHIMFDKNISMLEPIWLEDNDLGGKSLGKWPVKYDRQDQSYYETCVRLVLNDATLKNIAKLNSEMMEVFDGKLILFLHKLERMIFENKSVGNREVSIEHHRLRMSDDWTIIRSKSIEKYDPQLFGESLPSSAGASFVAEKENFWLTMRKAIEKPVIRRNGVIMDKTELVLALKFTVSKEEEQEQDLTVDSGTEQEGRKKRKQRTLSLDFKEGLLPMYAYLPTSNPLFHFIVQGDFILATNRESILTGNNDWNEMLLKEIPDLFLTTIRELAVWIQLVQMENVIISRDSLLDAEIASKLAENCPHLFDMIRKYHQEDAQASNDDEVDFMLDIRPEDLITLIPLPNRCLPQSLYTTIYNGLRDVAFIVNAQGHLISPKEALTTKHLHFDISSYLPDYILSDFLQRSLMDIAQQDRLDEEIIDALKLERFSSHHINRMLEILVDSYSTSSPSTLPTEECADSGESVSLAIQDGDGNMSASSQSEGLETNQGSADASSNKVKKTITREEYNSILSRLLLTLRSFCTGMSASSSVASTRSSSNAGLIPSQVDRSRSSTTISRQQQQQQQAQRQNRSSKEYNELKNIILASKKLPIWPLIDGRMAIMEGNTLLLPQRSQTDGGNSAKLAACIDVFKSDLDIIDARLFQAADEVVKGSSVNQDDGARNGSIKGEAGSDLLRSFLLSQFSPPMGSMRRNGLCEMGPEVIISTVFSRRYQSWSESGNDDNGNDNENEQGRERAENRLRFSAYLAFLFLSWESKALSDDSLQKLLKESGVIVPVLSARDHNKHKLSWSKSRCVRLFHSSCQQDASGEEEIHLGMEFGKSVTATFYNNDTANTALRQLGWTIVDPLPAAFIFLIQPGAKNPVASNTSSLAKIAQTAATLTNQMTIDSDGRRGYADVQLSCSDIQKAFINQSTSSMDKWREFLQKLGVVNFFKLRTTPIIKPTLPPMIKASDGEAGGDSSSSSNVVIQQEESVINYVPGLTRFLDHILRYGHRVVTSLQPRAIKSTTALSSEDEPIYIPIFLPRSFAEDQKEANKTSGDNSRMLSVTKDVYDTVKLIVPFIVDELQNPSLQQHIKGAESVILANIIDRPWFPVEIHPMLLSHGLIKPNRDERLYLLAAPKDVIIGKSERDLSSESFSFGAHAVYFPLDLFRKHLNSFYVKFFNMCYITHSEQPEISLMAQFWLWTSYYTAASLVSYSGFMNWIYKTCCEAFCEEKKDGNKNSSDSSSDVLVKTVDYLLTSNTVAVFWIPLEQQCDKKQYYLGKMMNFHELVKEDRGNVLPAEGPIKILSNYNYETQVKDYFTREKYCNSCKVIEGKFGTHGQSKSQAALVKNTCTCKKSDCYLGDCYPERSGFIAESPSLSQMVSVLRWYRGQFDGAPARDRHRQSVMKSVIDILSTISSNIWKCFHIKQALHPYSSDQLRQLIDGLQSYPLIPLYGRQGLTEVGREDVRDKEFLAVDDSIVFEKFKSVLLPPGDDVSDGNMVQKKTMVLLDGGLSSDDELQGVKRTIITFFNQERLLTSARWQRGEVKPPSSYYDLDKLEEESRALLNAPSPQFEYATRTIPSMTFFAPRNLRALFQLLHIPLLTDYLTEQVTKEVVQVLPRGQIEQCSSTRLILHLTELLALTEAFLLHYINELNSSQPIADAGDKQLIAYVDVVKKLSLSERLRKLFHSKVFECKQLQRCLTLNLQQGNILENAIVDDSLYIQTSSSGDCYEVFIQQDANADIITEVAVQLILQPLRTEIAVITQNQQAKLMKELEDLLRFTDSDNLEKYLPLIVQKYKLDKFYKLNLQHPGQTESGGGGDEASNNNNRAESDIASKVWTLINPYTIREELEQVETESSSPLPSCDHYNTEEKKVVDGSLSSRTEEDAATSEELPPEELTPEEIALRQREDEARTAAYDKMKEAERLRLLNRPARVSPTSSSSSSVSNSTRSIYPPLPHEAPTTVVEYVMQHQSSRNNNNQAHVSSVLDSKIMERLIIVGNESEIDEGSQVHQMNVPHDVRGGGGISSSNRLEVWRVGGSSFGTSSSSTASSVVNTTTMMPAESVGSIMDNNAGERGEGGGKGNNSGNGVWNPQLQGQQFSSHNNTSSSIMTDILLSNETIQQLLDQEVNVRTLGDESSIALPLVSNQLSGRLGERLAHAHLLATHYNKSTPWGLCTSIEWLNEANEVGKPYDIVMTFDNGGRKYCEVKTRSNQAVAAGSQLQWSISALEVSTAQRLKDNYFCILVSLQWERGRREMSVRQILQVGMECGLLQCLHDKVAHLFLQISMVRQSEESIHEEKEAEEEKIVA